MNEAGTDKTSRLWLLQRAVERAVKRLLKVVTLDQLVSLFPELANDKEDMLEKLHQALVSELQGDLERETGRLMGQYELSERLPELDALIKDALERESLYTEEDMVQLANPSAIPEQISLHKSISLKESELERLRQEMHELESRNQQLQEQVDYKRRCVDETRRQIALDQADMAKIFEQMSQIPLERLSELCAQVAPSSV
ncbi:hypothetical protein RI367_001658 [Sorochytrium milnesiophthora]